MLYSASFVILMLAGVYLVGLGAASLFAPGSAERFLLGFATSAFKHYLELALRFLAGAAVILQAPFLVYPVVFTVLGWILVGTTAILLLIPWKLHRHFAEKTVPAAVRHLPVIGLASLAAGVGVIACLIRSLVA
jgi:hypothetical protein